MKFYSAKLIIFSVLIALSAVFSGCGKVAPDKNLNGNENLNANENTNLNQNTNTNTNGEVDTSNWQTYRNEEYGFEVKYPEGWEVSSLNTSSAQFVSDDILFDQFNFIKDGIKINIVSGENVAGYKSSDQFDFGVQVGPLIQSKKVRLGEYEAQEYVFEGNNELARPENKNTLITSIIGYVDSEVIIEIKLSTGGKNRYKSLELFESVVGTFEFID